MVKGHHHHRHHNHHHDYHRHGHHHDEHLVEKEQFRSSAHEDSTEQESTGTIRVAERILAWFLFICHYYCYYHYHLRRILGDCYSLESRGPDGIAERQSAAPAASEDEPGVDAQVLPQLLNVAHQGLGAALELYYLQLILTWVLLSSSSAWGVDLPQPRWSICLRNIRCSLFVFSSSSWSPGQPCTQLGQSTGDTRPDSPRQAHRAAPSQGCRWGCRTPPSRWCVP